MNVVLNNRLGEIRRFFKDHPIDSIIEKKDWGAFNFEQIRAEIELLEIVATALSDGRAASIPDPYAQRIDQRLASYLNQVIQIDQVRTDQGDLTSIRNSKISHLRSELNHLVQEVLPWLSIHVSINDELVERFTRDFNDRTEGKISELEGQIDDLRAIAKTGESSLQTTISKADELLVTVNTQSAELSKKAEDVMKQLNDRAREASEIAESAREASLRTGLGRHEQIFDSYADSQDFQSWIWLGVTVALTCLSVWITLNFSRFWELGDSPEQWELWMGFSSKFVVVGLSVSLTAWSGTIFKALRHQTAVNKHKANALKTFEAFALGTDNEQIRDAVLIEATRSIFTLAPSGFLGRNDVQSDAPTTMMELVKTGASKD